MASKTYVGLDPSLTGFGVCLINGRNVVATTKGTKPADGLAGRLARIYTLLRPVVDEVDRWKPALIAIEGYAMHARNSRSVTPLVELGAIVRWELQAVADLVEVAPTTLKKFATGKGNADKIAVALAVWKRWEFSGTTDAVDAFVLAKIAVAIDNPRRRKDLTSFQAPIIEALETQVVVRGGS